MILGRDFIIRMGLVLDLRRGGYQHACSSAFYPFLEWTTPGADQRRTGERAQDDCSKRNREPTGNSDEPKQQAAGVLRGTGPSLPVGEHHGTGYQTPVVATAALHEGLQGFSGTSEQREMLEQALLPFSRMFTEKPGLTEVLEHGIDTGDARPWRCNPRPLSVHKRKLLDAALNEMIETGAVRPSRSPWAFPVVLAPKKDGTARLCMDYRRLNEVTVRDSYPFPSIDSIMYTLGSARVFTILDCSREFLQIPIAPNDVEKTAFTCHRGLFEFVRLPFGLSNSPASFQRMMDEVLGDAKYNFAMAYMDDVVIFSRSFHEHLSHLKVVLGRMQAAGLTVNPRKMQLATNRIDLLGFTVESGTVRPNEDKLKAILDYPRPQDVKSLQRFLGMIGFYRQFIPRCSDMTQPLTWLLRKGARWSWGEAQENAFSALTEAIAQVTSLYLPDLNRPFVMQTDASDYGLGAVLLQQHEGELRPVAFASRTLTSPERNYTVTEKECLAIMFALNKFDMYLDGAKFAIQTDHQALAWLSRLKNPAGRLARWSLTLQRYDFSIEYRRGTSNKVVDALSRAPLPLEDVVTTQELVAAVGQAGTDREQAWGHIRVVRWLETTGPADAGDAEERFDSYQLSEDGLLVRYIPQADDEEIGGNPFRIVVPRKLPTRRRASQLLSRTDGTGLTGTSEESGPVHITDLKEFIDRILEQEEGQEDSGTSSSQSQPFRGPIDTESQPAEDGTTSKVMLFHFFSLQMPRPPATRSRSRPQPRHRPQRPPGNSPARRPSPSPRLANVATWTVLVEGRSIGYCSRTRWRNQARPLIGDPPDSLPEPFRGLGLSNRHPTEPPVVYTEQERSALCPFCGVPLIHPPTHNAGALHLHRIQQAAQQRANNVASAPTRRDIVAAVHLLRQLAPQVLARPSFSPDPEDIILDLPELPDI
ncbi:uncharacterized protein LOC135369375 [Ornithodoros turicata]|uniref:uncharacterized protein LOC135369375 n=1 Tax=Ornithodoros turicata TaxID=34597 RepID=UPI003139E66A